GAGGGGGTGAAGGAWTGARRPRRSPCRAPSWRPIRRAGYRRGRDTRSLRPRNVSWRSPLERRIGPAPRLERRAEDREEEPAGDDRAEHDGDVADAQDALAHGHLDLRGRGPAGPLALEPQRVAAGGHRRQEPRGAAGALAFVVLQPEADIDAEPGLGGDEPPLGVEPRLAEARVGELDDDVAPAGDRERLGEPYRGRRRVGERREVRRLMERHRARDDERERED